MGGKGRYVELKCRVESEATFKPGAYEGSPSIKLTFRKCVPLLNPVSIGLRTDDSAGLPIESLYWKVVVQEK